MKNIEVKYVEELKEVVKKYKGYIDLYDNAISFSIGKERSDYSDIVSTIKEHIEDTIEDISHRIDDLYDDWSGISEARIEFRKTHDFGDTSFYEIEDEIRYNDEQIAGECQYIVGIADDLYVKMYSTPINFMKEFVAEYGIFTIDNQNDVWVA